MTEYIKFHKYWFDEKEEQAVLEVLRSGWITTGPTCEQLETALKNYTGAKYCASVNSCTAGLHILLKIAGVGPGDEVITTPFTFAATANVIALLGARPVFADIEADTLNIDPAAIAAKITGKTKAIMPVHMAGCLCRMNEIMNLAVKHKLKVIEDCAHALETRTDDCHAGLYGLGGSFSFYATKNITSAEGGAIITDDEDVHQRAMMLRLHGLSSNAYKRYGKYGLPVYDMPEAGFKYNLTDIAAALALVQLEKIGRFAQKREELWNHYCRLLAAVPEVEVPATGSGLAPGDAASGPAGFTHARHLFIIKVRDSSKRDGLINFLRVRNIGTTIHFLPVHLFSYYRREFGYKENDYPVCESVSRQVISLPFYPSLRSDELERVVDSIKEYVTGKS